MNGQENICVCVWMMQQKTNREKKEKEKFCFVYCGRKCGGTTGLESLEKYVYICVKYDKWTGKYRWKIHTHRSADQAKAQGLQTEPGTTCF